MLTSPVAWLSRRRARKFCIASKQTNQVGNEALGLQCSQGAFHITIHSDQFGHLDHLETEQDQQLDAKEDLEEDDNKLCLKLYLN